MLTPEQKQQILSSSNFQNLVKSPITPTANTSLSFAERAKQARQQSELPTAPTLPTQTKEEPGIFGETGFLGKVKEEGSRIYGRVKEDIGKRVETVNEKAQLQEEGKISVAQQIANFASQATAATGNALFELVVSLTPDDLKEDLKEAGADIAKSDIGKDGIEQAQKVGAWWEVMKKEHPEATTNIETAVNFAEIIPVEKGISATYKGGKKLLKGGIEVAEAGIDVAKKTGKEAVETVAGRAAKLRGDVAAGAKKVLPSGETVEGIKQIASETAERIPRVAERVKGKGEQAIARAKRIRESEPAVANAIKSNLDDRVINSVSGADDATRRAYKQVVDIAEESPKTIGAKTQPSKVSGDLAVKQYDTIVTKKKSVGKAIGDEVDKLSKTSTVDMVSGIKRADNILENQGIDLVDGVLDFKGSNFTPAERTKINELYKLATEGGDTLSPAQVRGKDQLFSKLQREANMEGVGSILVDTGDGKTSLFRVFRDIFSDKLDTVSPTIKKLNKEYRDLILITDDIESSILKTPNFNATKSADPSEFAKVNMRRIFGEAQSSPVFEAVADQMDALSRQLGYKDATPKQIAEFAIELRKLYPESIPKSGFQGGIAGGIKAGALDAVNTIIKTGTPDLADQRKALNELLGSYLGKEVKSTDKVIKKSLKKLPENVKSPISKEATKAVDEMYKKAPEIKKEIDNFAKEIADDFDGLVAEAPLKKQEKVEFNIKNKYDGDYSRVSDIARNTIVLNNTDDVAKAYKKLQANKKIISSKEVIPDNDALGYSGINAKYKASNGGIGEIQINTKDMIYAKEPSESAIAQIGKSVYNELASKYKGIGGKGHKYYDDWTIAGSKGDAKLKIKTETESKEYYNLFR